MNEDSVKNLTRTAKDHFGRVNYRVDVSGVSKLFPLPALVLCLCTGDGNPNEYLPKIGLLSMIGLGSCHSYAMAIKCWYLSPEVWMSTQRVYACGVRNATSLISKTRTWIQFEIRFESYKHITYQAVYNFTHHCCFIKVLVFEDG